MKDKMNLVLGTMTFGQQVMFEDALEMVRWYKDEGYRELDTAYVYNNGKCEEILGQVLSALGKENFSVATKVNPRISGKLDADAAYKQLYESLERMHISKADIFYLHFPDPNTPVDSVLEACARLHSEGKFIELGLSNFPAWLVVDVYHKCKKNGWVLPTVYEGVYNALSRKAEVELFLALREFNIRFYAYNPLAGGMLSGKYNNIEDIPSDGRFYYRPNYRQRYWKQSYFDTIHMIKTACEEVNIGMPEASYRWLCYHSFLDTLRGDAIIIGASKLSQLRENMSSVAGGPLPESVVKAFEHAWEVSKSDAPEYFKYYQKSK